MGDDLLIYVKQGKKEELIKRHPGVTAEWMEHPDVNDQPVVCKSENGEQRCEEGEQWIDAFAFGKKQPHTEESESE